MKNKRRRRAKKALGKSLLTVAILLFAMALVIVGGLLAINRIFFSQKETPLTVEYVDLIEENASEYALEPAYIAAVVMAESSYNSQAVSYADARGLMQILPDTAQWIAQKLDETYSEEMLMDPATNLRYGCWYLRFLMDRYGDDKTCASAAYHAGQGTVDTWLGDPQYSQDGHTLTAMAYASTDTYVSRVLNYYERYQKIYEEL